MEPQLIDSELLRRSLTQPSLFAAVYERHVSRVGRYLARRVGSTAAEDLTADVFVRAFRGRSRYQPEHETALPWLLGIANNVIGDHRRAERRRLRLVERVAGITPELMIDPEAPTLAPALARELRRLPTADRDTLLLVVWGELSYEEAASALGIPVGTVRSRIARARRRLADVIGPQSPQIRLTDKVVKGEAHA
jgi:RNA polymerase sigma factor (sigma-70 family)